MTKFGIRRGMAKGMAAVAVASAGAAFATTTTSTTPGPTAPQSHFTSTVQWAVHEPTPQLMRRAQKVVIDQFAQTFDNWPELHGKPYEVRTTGNEVAFYVVSNQDMRSPLQNAVSSMIQHLNGRVRARGRSLFYRTSLANGGPGGYLEVVTDDTHTKIVSVAAQSVPLRDLLKEIKAQMGSFSYLIPGECAERLVDWSFGEEIPHAPLVQAPKTLDTVMSEIATLFDLRSEKRNGTYIFMGACNDSAKRMVRMSSPTEMLRMPTEPSAPMMRPTQVYMPLMPIGE